MFSVPNASKTRYRSRRAVRRPIEVSTHIVTHWTKAKIALVCFGIGAIAMLTIMPIMMLGSTMSTPDSPGKQQVHVSLHNLIHKSIEVEKEYKNRGKNLMREASHNLKEALHAEIPDDPLDEEEIPTTVVKKTKQKDNKTIQRDTKDVPPPVKTLKKVQDPKKVKGSKKTLERKTVQESKKVVEPEHFDKAKQIAEPKLVNESNDETLAQPEKPKQLNKLVMDQPLKNNETQAQLEKPRQSKSLVEEKTFKKNETVVQKLLMEQPLKDNETQAQLEKPKQSKILEVEKPFKSNETLAQKLVAEQPVKNHDTQAQLEKPKQSKKLVVEQLVKNATAAATVKRRQLARGVSGLPMSQTPALVGAEPGHIECDINVDNLAYWNDPQGDRDRKFVSPFVTSKPRYLTFEPDMGGWNNIRMSMEIIFVLAAVTGRTLVLPPKVPFYLLGMGKEGARSFGNFFPLEHPDFARRVKIMTMQDFVEKERHGILNLTDAEYEKIKPAADVCVHSKASPINCEDVMYPPLRKVGFQPDLEGMKSCLIFDLDYFQSQDKNISTDVKLRAERFCGKTRKPTYYDDSIHLPDLIHWNAGGHAHRLLNHFYTFIYFTDPKIDNYYKRFVRDFLHYNDNIYCAAGKVIQALNAEGKTWSSMHVRRGDLQFQQVKISAEEWYNNTKEVWQENEILFIATDERNRAFFDPIKKYHDLRFLNDYWDVAKLGDLESTYIGMVDTIVASHGRAFAGTWFSTFTGYINRMRGYLGHSMNNSWYSYLPRKDAMQEWRYPEGNMPAREWPLGWVAIDGDVWIEHEGEPVVESLAQQ